jgi:polar amino acid transport system substrate-binding protein
MSIAIQTGSTVIDQFDKASEQCVTDGAPPIKLLQFQSNNDALLAVTSGRANAATSGNVNTQYQIKEANADLKVAGSLPQRQYAGITVQKDATDLADAISSALSELKSDGTYDKILASWKMPSAAVDTFPVNPNVQ